MLKLLSKGLLMIAPLLRFMTRPCSLLRNGASALAAISPSVLACCMLALPKPLSTLVVYGLFRVAIIHYPPSYSFCCITLLYYDIPITGLPGTIQSSFRGPSIIVITLVSQVISLSLMAMSDVLPSPLIKSAHTSPTAWPYCRKFEHENTLNTPMNACCQQTDIARSPQSYCQKSNPMRAVTLLLFGVRT